MWTMPCPSNRCEFDRLLQEFEDWNGSIGTVQVTEAGDTNIRVRLLMSAKDSTGLWNLRCAIREGIITFIQEKFPEHLPRVRARLVEEPTG